MILDTLFEPLLVTQMLVPSNATPFGFEPTVTVVETVLVAGLIFDTLREPQLVIQRDVYGHARSIEASTSSRLVGPSST